MTRPLTFLLTLLLLTTVCWGGKPAAKQYQPKPIEIIPDGIPEKAIPDYRSWTKFERKAIRRKRAAWGLLGFGGVLGVSSAAMYIRHSTSPNAGLDVEVGALALAFGSGFSLIMAGASGLAYKSADKQAKHFELLLQPYTITPQISRNGGGLEVAWKW